jgi:predicted CXXCH cytochrome family protein
MSAPPPFSIPAFILACSLTYGTPSMAADKCFSCHESMADKASAAFKKDIHYQKGISCAGCHGGDAASDDMEKAMSKAAGFLGVPHGDDISSRCAHCHANAAKMQELHSPLPTDQYALLQTSVHGKLSTTGKERIVQCTTCHHAHGIVSVKDPASPVHPLHVVKICAGCHSNASYVRSYNPGLPVDQMDKYRTSVHGLRNAAGDAKAAECVSCHGSHGVLSAKDVRSRVYPTNLPAVCAKCHADPVYMKGYGIPTNQYSEYVTSVHGVALLQKKDLGAPACNSCHGNHGATPPGVESISKVCGSCHALNADLFSSSPHKRAFDEKHLPECETCHGNHGVVAATAKMLGTDKDAVCTRCHSEQENAKGFHIAGVMRRLIDSLDACENSALSLVGEAEQKGMEITEAKFKLRDVRQARLEARTTVHAFQEEKFWDVVGKGLAISAVVTEEARQAVDEYFFRRIGLGIATLIITVLAVSLYMFIRRLERRQGLAGKPEYHSHTH